jgi:hypothetical protein
LPYLWEEELLHHLPRDRWGRSATLYRIYDELLISQSITNLLRNEFGVGVTYSPPLYGMGPSTLRTEDGFEFKSDINISETPMQWINRALQEYRTWQGDTWRILQEANDGSKDSN